MSSPTPILDRFVKDLLSNVDGYVGVYFDQNDDIAERLRDSRIRHRHNNRDTPWVRRILDLCEVVGYARHCMRQGGATVMGTEVVEAAARMDREASRLTGTESIPWLVLALRDMLPETQVPGRSQLGPSADVVAAVRWMIESPNR